MKKKLTSLATFMKKSSNTILFFIFLISFTQSCKKENLNPVSMKVEEAKSYYFLNILPKINQNEIGIKNLAKAEILWDKAVITNNEENAEVINLPIIFEEKFKSSYGSDEKISMNEKIFLEIIKDEDGKYLFLEVISLTKTSIKEVIVKFNIESGEENAYTKINGKLYKGSITKDNNYNTKNNLICDVWGHYRVIDHSDGSQSITLLYTYLVCIESNTANTGGGSSLANLCADAKQGFEDYINSITITSELLSLTSGNSFVSVISNDLVEETQVNTLKWYVVQGANFKILSRDLLTQKRELEPSVYLFSNTRTEKKPWRWVTCTHDGVDNETTSNYGEENFSVTHSSSTFYSGQGTKEAKIISSIAGEVSPKTITNCQIQKRIKSFSSISPTCYTN